LYRIFKTRPFARWMRKNRLKDTSLRKAVREVQDGLIDARLGGTLLKQRITLPGHGKRGSARSIVATRMAGVWVFLFGFNKNERDSLDPDELEALRGIAEIYLSLDAAQLDLLARTDELSEVRHATN